MQGVNLLTSGHIRKQLFELALPIMATSFIQLAYSLTDIAWVGHLGSKAAAAVGAVGILTWLANSISLLNKVGSEVSVGQSIGSQNEEDARMFASHNVTLALIISLCFGGTLFVFARPIIAIYDLAPDITAMSVQYLRIVASAMPFVFLSMAFTGIYNASGRSKIPFYISGTGLALNMILDPLLIYFFNMGTCGAAISTWIAQGCVFAIFVYQLRRRDVLLGRFAFLTRLKRKYTRRIFKIGLPVAVFNSLFAIVNMFMGRTASEQGGHIGVTALTVGGPIEGMTWYTSQGVSTALSAFVAQNYAANKMSRVFQALRTSFLITMPVGIFCTVLFVVFGDDVFSVFVPDKEAYLAGGRYLLISGYSQVFTMFEITMQGMFYGLGRTMPPAIVSICCNYSRIPIAILLTSLGMGLDGIWWAISATSIAKGIILSCWFFVLWKKHKKNLVTP
jgi:putative MATE family efflux protein